MGIQSKWTSNIIVQWTILFFHYVCSEYLFRILIESFRSVIGLYQCDHKSTNKSWYFLFLTNVLIITVLFPIFYQLIPLYRVFVACYVRATVSTMYALCFFRICSQMYKITSFCTNYNYIIIGIPIGIFRIRNSTNKKRSDFSHFEIQCLCSSNNSYQRQLIIYVYLEPRHFDYIFFTIMYDYCFFLFSMFNLCKNKFQSTQPDSTGFIKKNTHFHYDVTE